MSARGDRFIVLVLGTGADEATAALQRLRPLLPTFYQALNRPSLGQPAFAYCTVRVGASGTACGVMRAKITPSRSRKVTLVTVCPLLTVGSCVPERCL